MKHRWLGIVLIFFMLSCGKKLLSSDQDPRLAYEPAIVELSGQLKSVEKFGPPNYGESPETDQKIQVLILKLDSSMGVTGNPNSELNKDSFDKLTEVQLICSRQLETCLASVNKHISVKGTLSQAISGQQFTSVVLNVRELNQGK